VPSDPAANAKPHTRPTPEDLRAYAADLAAATRRVREAEAERDRRICEATARGMAFRDVAVITGVPFRRIVELFDAQKRKAAEEPSPAGQGPTPRGRRFGRRSAADGSS
jgi:hypothetical protein